MDPLFLKEQEKYSFLWEEVPAYRLTSPGELVVNYFLRHFESQMAPKDRVIDFGCGTGRAARSFLTKGLDVTLVDFCSNCLDPEIELLLSLFPENIRFIKSCLWDLSEEVKPAEWIYCCDVLEHIPEEKIDAVLKCMASCHLKGGYFSIALKQDNFGLHVLEEPLHLCIQDKKWWIKKLSVHWDIECEFVDLENNTNFHCCVRKA